MRRRLSGGRLLAALAVLAALVMVVDARTATPLGPARDAVGTVLGPLESAAGSVVRPLRSAAGAAHSNRSLRGDVARLQAQNSDLRSRLEREPLDRNRLAAYDGLVGTAQTTGYTLVPTHVVAMGPAQSFRRTVTLDAGTTSGIRANSTVVSRDGLVGRVVRATRTTATVLLVVDPHSVVGGRIGSTMKIGFVRGRGDLSGAPLDLQLVDDAVPPNGGDTVFTWGSGSGGPYVAGIPIGKVVSIRSTPRDQTQDGRLEPFVDFGALDLVGVVVPADTEGDRPLIHADGSLR